MLLITKQKGFENSGIVYTARILKADGTPMVQSDLTSITLKVWDMTDPAALIASPPVTVAGSVFNTLQTDPTGNIWTDSTGYNFKLPVDQSCFPEGDKVYRLEFKFVPVAGSYFYCVHEQTTLPIQSE